MTQQTFSALTRLRVRNIVDPPMLPDEPMRETKQDRRRRLHRESARRLARSRVVQVIY